MSVTFDFPTNAELNTIAQDKMPALEANREIFKILPTETKDTGLLMWEQMDNFLGLQQIRGLGGQPSRVKKVGFKQYQMQPGVYGEFADIDETELVLRRNMGSFNAPIDVNDLVMIHQDLLLQRRLDRIELIGWTLLSTGTFSVSNQAGGVVHTDTFTLQTYSAGTAWGTSATATPLADFRAVELLHRGHSVSFGAGATAYMNRTTYNQLISNTNDADLYGRRQSGLALINNLQDVNRLWAGDGLAEIVVYDEGYLDDTGTFQLFIPNNKAILIGKRPGGQVIGNYTYTRNASNPDLGPGPYMQVIDSLQHNNPTPRRIDVHDGHNGGPRIYFPSAIVVMTV